MAILRFESEVPVRRQQAFDLLVSHFRGLGFRLEEADRMNFKLVMDRGNLLGSLFGGPLSFRRVWLRANVRRISDERAALTIEISGWGKAANEGARSAYAAEIRRYEEQAAALPKMVDTPGTPPPAVVREVIMKEIVRIPCKFCGSLMDNTERKCPDCGAPQQ
ncbi:MAG: hypothetical protein ABI333_17375 [bacterium]